MNSPTVPLLNQVGRVTERIRERSLATRTAYLMRMHEAAGQRSARSGLHCTNLAHAAAASVPADKQALKELRWPNVAIVTAYNDMLSAHQPFERYPAVIRTAAREAGATAQVAGGVPAMCDGVTQGQPGMELSLFSRDVIAMSTALALTHGMFDGTLCLGVCDKIVPGLLIGALSFGQLPTIFVPAGPMTTGAPNKNKAQVRQLYAEGKLGRDALLESESQSYHGAGTCTFYGTANSNQMLMEVMGLHMPGSAFVHPHSTLREALTAAAAQRVAKLTSLGNDFRPLGPMIDERSIVNAIVGLLATGGSTNHTIHLIAMARAAGIQIDWDDFASLSQVVPMIARIYPNGSADINHFHAAGGMAFVIRELLGSGLLHADARTVVGDGLVAYTEEPWLDNGSLRWRPGAAQSGDLDVLRPVNNPFSADGGLKLLRGNLGRAVIKVSAIKPEHRDVAAPARVFDSQEAVLTAFKSGALDRDVVVVLRGQGPRANGMPELHGLTPALSSLQSRGFHVALVTDGRMSGASGNVPAAIHLTPEYVDDGPIGRLRDGDLVRIDCARGTLEAQVAPEIWAGRPSVPQLDATSRFGFGRELFHLFRANAAGAEQGGGIGSLGL
ncbi:MAG TPA: phosphogluconate dehydratase [Steroidobacteraceae bacterium]